MVYEVVLLITRSMSKRSYRRTAIRMQTGTTKVCGTLNTSVTKGVARLSNSRTQRSNNGRELM